MTARIAFARSGLVGRWIHAHERDTDAARVYVGPGVKLAPSRGRTCYEFSGDGSFVESGPGPADRTTARTGRASVEDGTLVLRYSNGTARRLRFERAQDGSLRLLRSMT